MLERQNGTAAGQAGGATDPDSQAADPDSQAAEGGGSDPQTAQVAVTDPSEDPNLVPPAPRQDNVD